MDGANKVIGLWRARGGEATDSGVSHSDTPYYSHPEDEDFIPTGRWRRPVALTLCLGAALLWSGAFGWSRYLAWTARPPVLDDILSAIAGFCVPLVLLAIVWLLLLRSSRAETSAFARTARALQVESERMDGILSFVSARIEASRRDLAEQGDTLLSLGDDAAKRLSGVTSAIRKEIDTISNHTQNLKGTTSAARGDLAVLLSHLPKAQVQMRQIASALVEAGTTAQDKAVALGEQVVLLSSTSLEAGETAKRSANELTAQLAQLVEQGSEFASQVDDHEARLRAAGGDATEQLGQRVKEIGAEVDRISGTFSSQDEASRALLTRINSDIGDLEARFAAFDAHGKARGDELGLALNGLRDHASALALVLKDGDTDVVSLTGKTEALLTALDAAAREIDETLPTAYSRLEQSATQAMSIVDQAVPAIAQMSESAQKTRDNLANAEVVLDRQRTALSTMTEDSSRLLSSCKAEAAALAAELVDATEQLRTLSDGAGSQLLDTLVRARDTARQAADHARDAFNDVIPQTAASFGEMSKQALGDALTTQVEAQMKEIASTTEKAVAIAQKATDRLMRQMLTISETSAALESRIAEAKDEAERADQGNFARRVALLIESLNSSAIDVTKILSNDVTDTAWAAYLRGDRGVFSRRAVRLLDSSEAKEIVRYYQDDMDFREQVNRYIHDYESMLRNVMSTRDGTPLSVALLSSDTGKLYVALAQAIERLRS